MADVEARIPLRPHFWARVSCNLLRVQRAWLMLTGINNIGERKQLRAQRPNLLKNMHRESRPLGPMMRCIASKKPAATMPSVPAHPFRLTPEAC